MLIIAALPGVSDGAMRLAIDGALPGHRRRAHRAAPSCAPPSSTAWNCPRAASSGASPAAPAATTRSSAAPINGCLVVSLRKVA